MDKKELEIMAPAGNFECLHAAIQGGTSLAIQLGHRQSEDLGFMAWRISKGNKPEVDWPAISKELENKVQGLLRCLQHCKEWRWHSSGYRFRHQVFTIQTQTKEDCDNALVRTVWQRFQLQTTQPIIRCDGRANEGLPASKNARSRNLGKRARIAGH